MRDNTPNTQTWDRTPTPLQQHLLTPSSTSPRARSFRQATSTTPSSTTPTLWPTLTPGNAQTPLPTPPPSPTTMVDPSPPPPRPLPTSSPPPTTPTPNSHSVNTPSSSPSGPR